jgi:ClpP class serine protease
MLAKLKNIGKGAKHMVVKEPIIARFTVSSNIDKKSEVKLQKAVERAMASKKKIKAVAFVIDSRGGSPVYSDLMAQKVLNFASKKDAPLYTFAESYAASGGYYLLCIGHPGKVYANESSMVGSIGVISASIASRKILDNYKIDRTEITTSENLDSHILDSNRFSEVPEEAI